MCSLLNAPERYRTLCAISCLTPTDRYIMRHSATSLMSPKGLLHRVPSAECPLNVF